MAIGIGCLILGYVLSQFFRAFMAVMAPVLTEDLGATAALLADASGMWFLTFALAQLPIGWALDKVGPRRTAAVLLAAGGAGGSIVFAMAQGTGAILLAMALIGVGCAPVLMAAYFIFARTYTPAMFGTLAGATIGIGSLGNLGAALPMSLAVEAFGWRGTMLGLAALTLAVAVALWIFVRDPPRIVAVKGDGSLWQVLRVPGLWFVMAMLLVNYAPAGGIRGLWAGPYFTDVFGAPVSQVGMLTLLMGMAMVLGSFAYGPLDRVFGTRKGVILCGNLAGLACLTALWWMPGPGLWTAALLIAGVGLFGTSFPMLMAHGRAYFPPHLAGRGVTMLNLFGIGGVGLFQVISGRVFEAVPEGASAVQAYGTLFGFFALVLAAGCLIYAFAEDRTD